MVVVAEHVGEAVGEEAAVRVVTTALGSTPKIGVAAEIVVAVVVEARRQRTEACGVVLAGRVAYGTGIGAASPTRGTRQCLGNRVVASAHILALTAHIVGQLGPFRIARHMPAVRANTLHHWRSAWCAGWRPSIPARRCVPRRSCFRQCR